MVARRRAPIPARALLCPGDRVRRRSYVGTASEPSTTSGRRGSLFDIRSEAMAPRPHQRRCPTGTAVRGRGTRPPSAAACPHPATGPCPGDRSTPAASAVGQAALPRHTGGLSGSGNTSPPFARRSPQRRGGPVTVSTAIGPDRRTDGPRMVSTRAGIPSRMPSPLPAAAAPLPGSAPGAGPAPRPPFRPVPNLRPRS